jgi:branched-subunit amino acid aminotransferase/4-amino-4-deoxychorismate lyase
LKLINFSILILAPENAALGPGCRETQREAESLRHYPDEAFLNGTFGAQTPVVEIDGKPIGTGVRPVTKTIRALYKDLIAGL